MNYRVLKDVTLGKLWYTPEVNPLTPLTAVIGKNGVGKSSLFDAFGFLADCLKLGVEEACDAKGRGGFDRIQSQGTSEHISLAISFKQNRLADPITYFLGITKDKSDRPYVYYEGLGQQGKGQQSNELYMWLVLTEGRGYIWESGLNTKREENIKGGFELSKFFKFIDSAKVKTEEIAAKEDLKLGDSILIPKTATIDDKDVEFIELQDRRKLGIATLGGLKEHPRISAFREFIEGWYLSYFTPDAARSLPLTGPQKHLNSRGDNIGNVVQFMEREHSKNFKSILSRIADKIPGIDKIDTVVSEDGRLLLRFNDRGFEDPFYAQQMSDGTLKAFAYLLLLEDPSPPPLICIEEPENCLYHKLLETLVSEFRSKATGKKNTPQFFITTHQPYLVDALSPEEVWVLEKGEDGFAKITRASDIQFVKSMVNEGQPLGALWYSDYLDPR